MKSFRALKYFCTLTLIFLYLPSQSRAISKCSELFLNKDNRLEVLANNSKFVARMIRNADPIFIDIRNSIADATDHFKFFRLKDEKREIDLEITSEGSKIVINVFKFWSTHLTLGDSSKRFNSDFATLIASIFDGTKEYYLNAGHKTIDIEVNGLTIVNEHLAETLIDLGFKASTTGQKVGITAGIVGVTVITAKLAYLGYNTWTLPNPDLIYGGSIANGFNLFLGAAASLRKTGTYRLKMRLSTSETDSTPTFFFD